MLNITENSKKVIRDLLYKEFHSVSYRFDAHNILMAAVEVLGINNETVQEMISDYQFEYKLKFHMK